ncbi:hypothetical protein [Halorussus sp. MSC15.2]|uniref:hypothetical protein n=1 Tax=Halorussus sp. MSC15.2 TaxID=2283638 RepID=UPI0013D08548|nr:hypothetical protein [Halorussus sp. MSC15.2]NEU57751.1 hypothetical protein [Halorussus sp. MSC15.2]
MQNLRKAVVCSLVAVLVASVSVAPVTGAASAASGSGGVTVHASPDATDVATGETTTTAVVASNVTAGVGAYNLTVALSNASVARIADYSLVGGPEGASVETNADNSSLRVTAYGVDTDQNGTVELVRLELAGETVGESDVDIDVRVIGDEAGNEYEPVSVSAGTLSVSERPRTTTTTSDGGSGRGGGGGANVPPPPVQLSTERTDGGVRLDVRNARPGESAGASVAGLAAGDATLERVDLEFVGETAHVVFELTGADGTPDGITRPPGDAVLGHVAVATRYASASVVGRATYRFGVSADALPGGATLDDVTVYRYADGSWTEVRVVRDSNAFTATTDRLSQFAVVVDRSSDNPVTSTAATETTGEGSAATGTTGEEAGKTANTGGDAEGGVPGFGGGVTLGALVGGVLFALGRR